MNKSESAEVARILQVYEEYDRNDRVLGKWSDQNRGWVEAVRERDACVDRVLQGSLKSPPETWRILEVGCGGGKVLAGFRRLGARDENLHGLDLRPTAIERARRDFPRMNWIVGNGEMLPFGAEAFDCVAAFTVFTSILDRSMSANMAREIKRVLRPGGIVLWYDFRFSNPWNRNVRAMTRREIRDLFPGFEENLRSVTLLPQLARRLTRFTRASYRALSRLPFLRTHYLGSLGKPIQ